MPENISRRQLLKYSKTSLVALSSLNLINLLANSSTTAAENIISNLELQIPKLMQKASVPGVSIAIIRNQKLFWYQAFGFKNQYTKKPVTNKTVFAAASLSKPLFAYAVLKMVERGELNLDTPLTEYTDKPYIPDSRIKLINTRKVLSHTTGFPNWSGSAPLWIKNQPGTKFGYSGEGFLYLQKIVEQITNQPLEDYLQQQILIPFGMDSSSFIWQDKYTEIASYGHDRQGKPKVMGKPKAAVSAGSLRTTAADYAQFIIAMMQSGAIDSSANSSSNNFRLTESSLKQMLTPQTKISRSIDWGLGWGLEKTNKDNFFWHWGDLVTFKSFVMGSRNLQTGIVILTNSQNGLKICEQIISQAVGGKHPAFKFWMIDY
ncbi:MAG: serine hydrolase domain-containing protein [Cyanobacteria bacterium P01_A01_bin.84]